MRDPLAVVGMACRVPGAADYTALWAAAEAGRTGMVEVTEEDRQREGIVLPADLRNPYVGVAAPLADHDKFDYRAFGLTAGEADGINVNHRVMMEVVLEALEDAGCDPLRFPGRIGLFAAGGAASPITVLQRLADARYGDTARPLKSSEALNWVSLLDHDFLSTRTAFALDLRGPAISVQSACSSSLVAVHLASQSLWTGECEMVVVGGVNIEHPQRAGYYHQAGSIWSVDGVCRPFDRAATGTISASGAGAVVVKRLERAVADGDAIHAVIRGSAINNDGKGKAGFTAPSVGQQSRVIREALSAAGVDAADIGFIETHGTATAIGDLVEWEGIARALGAEGLRCALGAVKANVGHLGAAAGIIGLIKAALVVSLGRIPPVANFVELNPRIDWHPRLFVPSIVTAWEGDRPRRAGVSSMGVGGTNAHVILEQPPASVPSNPSREGVHVLPVSAASVRSAEVGLDRVTEFATHHPNRVGDLAHTLRTGRRVLTHRQAAVADTHGGEVGLWRTESRQAKRTPATAFVFPGQGTVIGSLTPVVTGIDGFANVFTDALTSLAYEDQAPVAERLTTATDGDCPARISELAVLVRSVVLARSLIADGVQPRSVCGYSLGEVAAGVIAGVFTLADAATAISQRARILDPAPPGAMLRVRLPADALDTYLRNGVSVAIVPGANDCIVSGATSAIEALAGELRAAGIAWGHVPVPHPFHSSVLEPYVSEYTATWAALELKEPTVAVMSSTNGAWLDRDTALDPAYWAGHLVRTVRFHDAMCALRADGTDFACVLDSGAALLRFTKEVFDADAVAVCTANDPAYTPHSRARLLATAWTAGHDDALPTDGGVASVIHAPTYAFDRGAEMQSGTESAGGCEPAPGALDTPELIAPKQAEKPGRAAGQTPSAALAFETLPEQAFRTLPRQESVAAAVHQIVANLVGTTRAQISLTASFVELGYDSFLLIQLADALTAEFGVDVDVRLLYFERDSSALLAEHVAGLLPPTWSPSDAVAAATAPRATPVQVVPAAVLGGRGEVPSMNSAPQPAPTDAPVVEEEQEWARRTPVSKRITEEDRYTLADQRNVVFSLRSGRREVSYPVVGVRGEGSHFVDVDGREYLDLCMGFGVTMLGHASKPVTEALRAFEPTDLLLGPQSSTAGDVARGIAALTGVDRVGFATSGTEAVMAAVRAARATTGRDLIAMFAGSFHGTFDGVLAARRAGGHLGETTTLGRGTPAGVVADVILVPYDETAIPILQFYGERMAAVLVEPVQSRRPGYQPRDLLHRLRTLTSECGAALIFDEIITGFRCHPAGAAGFFGVKPDLVTYGKVIGGGMPIGVIAGDVQFMAPIDGGRWRPGDAGLPQRPSMVFSGTFSKQPMTMAVANHIIDYLRKESPRLQNELTRRTADLAAAINALCAVRGFPVSIEHFSSLFRINVDGTERAENMFFLGLLSRGVYVWEGRTCFLSTAHDDDDCARIIEAVAEAAAEVAEGGLWQGVAASSQLQSQPQRPASDNAASIVAKAPLTDGQKLLWMSSELGGDREASYRMSDVYRIQGGLDEDRLAAAIAAVAERHEALRIGFEPDGTAQNCVGRAEPSLTRHALGITSAVDVETLVEQFARRPVDMAEPSLFRFQLVRAGEVSFVQATAPHAVVDGWSFDLLWQEVSACYLGHGSTLEAPASFLDYARGKRAEEDARFEANAALWRPRLDPVWTSGRMIDGTRPFTPVTRSDSFTRQSLTELRALARAGRCTMHTAALSAVAVASSLLIGAGTMIVMAHRTGQPLRSGGPLIGFCVDKFPVVIELPNECSIVDVTRDVQEQLIETLGITAGLYRLLQQRAYRELPASLLTFEYAHEAAGNLFGFPAAPLALPRDSMPGPVLITVEEHATGLEMISEVSDESELAPYAAQLADAVRRVLANPSLTLGALRGTC